MLVVGVVLKLIVLEWTDRAREKAEMASQAVKRGVPEERLAGARGRGRELDEEARLRHSREEAAEALDAAVEGADPDALRAVLESATKPGAASQDTVLRALPVSCVAHARRQPSHYVYHCIVQTIDTIKEATMAAQNCYSRLRLELRSLSTRVFARRMCC